MTRTEKLFNMRAQVAKAANEIEHGDTYAACGALGDALGALLDYLEEELPEKAPLPAVVATGEGDHPKVEQPQIKSLSESIKRPLSPIQPEGEEVKEPLPTKIKRIERK